MERNDGIKSDFDLFKAKYINDEEEFIIQEFEEYIKDEDDSMLTPSQLIQNVSPTFSYSEQLHSTIDNSNLNEDSESCFSISKDNSSVVFGCSKGVVSTKQAIRRIKTNYASKKHRTKNKNKKMVLHENLKEEVEKQSALKTCIRELTVQKQTMLWMYQHMIIPKVFTSSENELKQFFLRYAHEIDFQRMSNPDAGQVIEDVKKVFQNSIEDHSRRNFIEEVLMDIVKVTKDS